MKNLCTLVLCASMLLCSLCSSSQNAIPINEPNVNKPRLFLGYPETVPVRMESLTGLFSLDVGRSVNLSLSDETPFLFDGSVVSAVSKYNNTIQSIVVRSTNLPGARLTVSRITDERGGISYTGRIISMQHGDLYELKKINEQFFLVKRKFYDLVNE